MRVAMVSDWYLPRLGGIELYLADLTTRLAAAGHGIEVLTPVPGPDRLGDIPIHRLAPAGGYRFPPAGQAANFPDLLYTVELLAGPARPSALARLRQALAGGGYDLAHIHLGNTPFAYLAVRAAMALGLPVVATFHSVLGGAERPVAALAARLLDCAGWPQRVELTAVSTVAASARAVMFGMAPFAILPNGVDARLWDEIRRQRIAGKAGSAPRPLEFVATLRLHSRKRPQLLIDAMAELRRHLPADLRVRLRIAGDGPLRDSLARRIARLGVGDRIELLGQVPRQRVAELLSEADLFLMPSRLESFGIAALEARIAGVPVLALRQSGAVDFLAADRDSLLAANDREFIAALIRFAGDAPLRQRLVAGSSEPLTGYAWADVVARCEAAYRRALVRSSTT
jgi:glycosyltransferase involved in cell wall biosynthesis